MRWTFLGWTLLVVGCLTPGCRAEAGGEDVGTDTQAVDTRSGIDTRPAPDTRPERDTDTRPADATDGRTSTDTFSRDTSQADDDTETRPDVAFVEPSDGATVSNPVTFVIEARDVAKVQIVVDDYPLSDPWDPAQKRELTYDFTGTGRTREAVLQGFDDSESVADTDTIHITVRDRQREKGESIGTFWNTYYYLSDESTYSGADDTTLYDANCQPLAEVPAAFSDDVCIEGSGLLEDGTVINYATTCSCGRPCPTGGTVCYKKLDKSTYPWGEGSRGNPLEPLRSWAVDTSVISHGTVLYVPKWDGVEIPQVDGLGGFTHDGCFRADDVGGGIDGKHYDLFAGTEKMWQELEDIYPTRTDFELYKNSPRCSGL